MGSSHLIPVDLRRLLRAIVHGSIASTSLIGCAAEHRAADAGEHDEPGGDKPETADDDQSSSPVSTEDPEESESPIDASVAPPLPEAGARDASNDSSRGDAGDADAGDADAGDADAQDASDASDDAAGHAGWQLVPCDSDKVARPSGLSATVPTGYLAVYADRGSQIGLPDGGATRITYPLASIGPACSGASDVPRCEADIAQLAASRGCAEGFCQFAISGTEGNFFRLNERGELLTLLGSIDSAAEAVMLAAFDGHALCSGTQNDPRDIGTQTQRTLEGFALLTTRDGCDSNGLYSELLHVATNGLLILAASSQLVPPRCVAGRRPARWNSVRGASQTELGRFLAQAAQLEAASIFAFYQLIRELRAHGAPEELRLAALDALLDEVRHARAVAELAAEHGAETPLPEVNQSALRSLLDMALDNVSEGCVRETFGALIATHQAETAENARIRSVMAGIAEDETRHATLSWQLMGWLMPQLSAAEQALVEAERARAFASLRGELDAGLSAGDRLTLGLPTQAAAAEMLRQMAQALAGGDSRRVPEVCCA